MAFAILASLYTTTEKMLNPDPFLIPCQKETIQSLHENIVSLLSFLENTPPHRYQTTKTFEAKIRYVGYKAEDILDSYISKQSHSFYKKYEEYEAADQNNQDFNSPSFSESLSDSLEEVMKGFESLMEEMKDIQTHVVSGGLPERMASLFIAAGSSRPASVLTTSPSVAGFSRPTTSGKNNFFLVDEDMMMQIKEQLASTESRLKVIPIVGMGGIGKTTLAKALIDDPFTSSHFDVRGWVTISQQYSLHDIVEKLLKDITGEDQNNENLSESKVQLHKTLYGRRYVVVLDDLWDTKACDELLRLFPDLNNGSRIMVTTRQSGVATFAAKSSHEMKLLNDDTSWDLLRQVVFGKQGNNSCPPELIEIGKQIARKCSGLPLAISVIGGLLSKEKIMTVQHWEQVADNMKSVLTEEGDQCLEILSLSYNLLPHHLKACFLYMGLYPEDYEIRVSKLLKFWVAEGFLKPGSTNNEEVAEENLNDLIQRNLILVEKLKYNGKTKSCKIHDLMRDLCIREAWKEKFLYVLNKHEDFNHDEANGHRRLSILPEYKKGEFDIMQSIPGNRSLMCFEKDYVLESNGNELLRLYITSHVHNHFKYEHFPQLGPNLRLLFVQLNTPKIAPSIFNLWDLQYLFDSDYQLRHLPQCIWFMPQLRHISVKGGQFPPLPPKTERPCVLKRLEVLSEITNFRCDDEVLLRIPNLKKLKICYYDFENQQSGLDNLVNMSKLETFSFSYVGSKKLVANLSFPISLKKLGLFGCEISWEHVGIIGLLPNLEVLKLLYEAFVGPVWETSEGHFQKLEYLMIQSDMNEWIVEDSNHFPSLRHLYLKQCEQLEEVPTCIGEIPTLEKIVIETCSKGVRSSVKTIQDDYNNDIKLVINGNIRNAYDHDDEEDDDDYDDANDDDDDYYYYRDEEEKEVYDRC